MNEKTLREKWQNWCGTHNLPYHRFAADWWLLKMAEQKKELVERVEALKANDDELGLGKERDKALNDAIDEITKK